MSALSYDDNPLTSITRTAPHMDSDNFDGDAATIAGHQTDRGRSWVAPVAGTALAIDGSGRLVKTTPGVLAGAALPLDESPEFFDILVQTGPTPRLIMGIQSDGTGGAKTAIEFRTTLTQATDSGGTPLASAAPNHILASRYHILRVVIPHDGANVRVYVDTNLALSFAPVAGPGNGIELWIAAVDDASAIGVMKLT